MSKNDNKWVVRYEQLKAYIEDHHHLPAKDSSLNAKYLLNWVKYQRKRIKAETMPEEQKVLLEALLATRRNEHPGGRRRKYNTEIK